MIQPGALRICPKCEAEKSTDDFYAASWWCKSCQKSIVQDPIKKREYRRASVARNGSKYKLRRKAKRREHILNGLCRVCNKPAVNKLHCDFHREQHNSQARARRKNSPVYRIWLKVYRATSPKYYSNREKRRILLLQGIISTEILRHQFFSQDGRCFYCALGLIGEVHMEHMIPLSRGGLHVIENVVWACGPCNNRKGIKTISEFILEL